MAEENKRQKRNSPTPDPSPQRGGEHKKNWREEYATVDDIRSFLDSRIYLRHNLVTRRTECRQPERDFFLSRGRTVPKSGNDSMRWQVLTDRIVNTLWMELSEVKPVRIDDIHRVVRSEYVPEYHPFIYYLEHLPPWDGQNYILELSSTVNVKGGVKEQMYFYECLRCWLVGMVAGWVDEAVVNHLILILIGKQGCYKTTWFNYLLPPELHDYFRIKTDSRSLNREDRLALTQYALMCCEELDTMKPSELNNLKSAVTMTHIDERVAYDRYIEHSVHVASFCGTGNNVQFLTDETGNRRWMPFEVESIDNPRTHPLNYAGIYAEAYALYKNGFKYFDPPGSNRRQEQHNKKFETPREAQELIGYYFRKPVAGGEREFMPTAIARQVVGAYGVQPSTVALGRAFAALGFEADTVDRMRGYWVVRLKDDERRARMRTATGESGYDYSITDESAQITDGADVF